MIFLTGMHRSGTSLAALVLRDLGLTFGPESELYGADDWNAHGYLERNDVIDINSRLITGADRTTSRRAQAVSQLSYLGHSIRHKTGAHSKSHVREASGDLANKITDLGQKLGTGAAKDPRFCLTMTEWRRHVEFDGLVVALRHPAEAVASLQRRNRIPAALGHRFWRWHMTALLPHIDSETLVLRQDELVGTRSSETIERAKHWLENRGVECTGDGSSVIDSSLVHHRNNSDAPAASLKVWDALCRANSFTP